MNTRARTRAGHAAPMALSITSPFLKGGPSLQVSLSARLALPLIAPHGFYVPLALPITSPFLSGGTIGRGLLSNRNSAHGKNSNLKGSLWALLSGDLTLRYVNNTVYDSLSLVFSYEKMCKEILKMPLK